MPISIREVVMLGRRTMIGLRALAVAGVILLGAAPTAAGTILQNVSNEARNIVPWVGQTFTAEDPFIDVVGAFVTDFSFGGLATDSTIDYELYTGVGIGGTLLGTRTFSGLFEGFDAFADVSFAGIPLIVGASYSVIVRNDTAEWAVESAFGDFYAGGELLLPSPDDFDFDRDLRFHVLPAAVPEPATTLLLTAGVVVLAARRRRRGSGAHTSSGH